LLNDTKETYKAIDLATLNPQSTYWPFVLIDAISWNPFGTLRPSVFPQKLFQEIGSSVPGAQLTTAVFPTKESLEADSDEESGSDEEGKPKGYQGPTFDAYTVPCTSKGFLDITLGKATNISVPFSHLIIPRDATGKECILSILATSLPPPPPSTNATNSTSSTNNTQPTPQPQPQKRSELKLGDTEYFILGSAIMEHVYMVFDHQRTNIWTGQRTDCGEQILSIGKDDGGDRPGVLSTEGCNCNGTSERLDDGGEWAWSERVEVKKKKANASPILPVLGVVAIVGMIGLGWRYRAKIKDAWETWDFKEFSDKCRDWWYENFPWKRKQVIVG
jgi:hypothetical protein